MHVEGSVSTEQCTRVSLMFNFIMRLMGLGIYVAELRTVIVSALYRLHLRNFDL